MKLASHDLTVLVTGGDGFGSANQLTVSMILVVC